MITGEWKPIEQMITMLEQGGHRRVLLVGCATCMAECATGGEREVETLAPLLRMALKKRGAEVRLESLTLERQCEWELIEPLSDRIEELQADAILSIGCGIGVQTLADRFLSIPVYPGVNTTCLAVREEPGLWASRCAACGDCVLGETFGLCPIARCSKSLLNGPCGGTRGNKKCEIDGEIDCVWTLIVERAEARGQLERLLRVRPTQDWSSSRHGGPKRIVREDLQD